MKTWLKENFGWPVVVLLAASFMLVYVIPPHWVRAVPGMNEFLKFIPAQLPGIQRYIAVSQMPEIASVFFPIVAILSPLMAYEVWRQPRNPARWATDFWPHPFANSFKLLLSLLLTGGIAWVTYFVGGYEINAFSIKNSHFYLALFGAACAGGGVWAFLGLSTRSIYSIFYRGSTK